MGLDRTAMLCIAVSALALVAGGRAQENKLELKSLSSWDIVLPSSPQPAERYAAKEFQRLAERAGGGKIPITAEPEKKRHHIFIGPSRAMRESSAAFATDKLGEEDVRIRIRPDNIALAGGSPRGTLYAVYTFLEDEFGVRFLAPDHIHVPKLGRRATLVTGQRTYRPPLRFRYSYYGPNHLNHDHAVRLRNNAITDEPRLGGRTEWRLINHTLSGMVPWRRYGEKHPEYYAEIDGQRPDGLEGHQTYAFQVCPSHPEVISIVTREALKRLRENPHRRNISVSQADNRNYCRCEKCRAINEREGSPMGAHLRMVNKVAEKVEREFPDVLVGTLAYQYTREAPENIVPRGNVMIQLCSIECCQMHPINDPECRQNRDFCEDLAEWGEICDQIHVWHYNVNFLDYLSPVPNLHTIEPNVRYFLENNVKGLFMQAAGGTRGASLANLRNYIICNMIWEPSRSGDQLQEEFLRLHYGAAAGTMRKYVNLLHDNARERDLHHHCFGTARDYGVDEEIVRRGLALFEKALQEARTDHVRRRVEKASIAMHRAAIEPVVDWIKEQLPRRGMRDEKLAVEMLLEADMPTELARSQRPEVRKFLELCHKHEVNRINERVTLKSGESILRAAFGLGEDETW